jgi:hypothetical protein
MGNGEREERERKKKVTKALQWFKNILIDF